ncbi:hypothetical protein KEM56_005695 [Ascosphaera pollenicola]|nr:hypothetical protein KEM56_005695 [Ascosphaera pollenicola]
MEATVQRRETPAHDDAASQITRYSFRSIASHVFSPKEAEDPASPEGNQPRIGGVSATFLIFNRIMGTGVFATPGVIMQLTGSAGLSLMLWLLGTFIAISGAAVYLEFGTAIPNHPLFTPQISRNGGEKNYLEYVYSKPMFLTTAVYATYAMCLGWCSSNSVVFGEYMLHAAHMPVGRWNQRLVGLACLTTAFMIQSVNVNWGLRITNILGMFKFAIVIVIIIGGCMALDGKLKIDERPDNLSHPFQGSTPSAYGIVTALYSVVFSYIGYANANYVLGETRNPEHTLKVAASMAVSIAGVIYMLINVAYFAAVPREDIMNLEAGKSIAALFFRNVFGSRAETALSVFVALSAFGTVQAILFSQGRIIQELGRQGVLPYSRFFASNKPFDSPAAGLFEHYVISSLIMILPPPGDAFKFLLK